MICGPKAFSGGDGDEDGLLGRSALFVGRDGGTGMGWGSRSSTISDAAAYNPENKPKNKITVGEGLCTTDAA